MPNLPSVLVIGGGFAGTEVAARLGQRARVTIVSRENFLLFTPMLAEVAAADIDPRHISPPVRELCPDARFVLGEAVAVDPSEREVTVQLALGPRRRIRADAVVLATGSVQATFGVPGVEEWALPFKEIVDAVRIRNRLLTVMETASETGEPTSTRVVVVGAGFSGAEVAAALSDFLQAAWRRFYPKAPRPRVTLVDAVERVTPMLPASLSAAAERTLGQRGVELILGRKVTRVAREGLELEGADPIQAGTVIWAAGVRPRLLEGLDELTTNGRLAVDRNLRLAPGLYALGDTATVPDGRGGICPPTAQHALRQGRYLGRYLPDLLEGRSVPPFRYGTKGQLVSLGHRNAVGTVMGIRVSGFAAWWLWRAYYLRRLPTLARKVRVALDWALDLAFPPDVAGLPTSDLGPLVEPGQ